jgi:signal transduction histidine kinase
MSVNTPTRLYAKLLRRGRHSVLLALGGVLVLSLFVSSYWQASASLGALGGLQLQAERLGRLDSLLIQLIDAENGVRGYLLSRNRSYLEPYFNSLSTVEYTLEDIRHDTGPDAQDQEALAQLTGLVTIKLRILSEAVAQGRVGDETPPGPGTSAGQHYMETIRATLAELKGRMAARGQRSLEQSIGHVQRTRWVVAALAGGALVLLGLLFGVLRRQFQLREQIADMLHSENQRLDRLVQARTAELSDLASYLTTAREVEQARLARELHDELGALLTAARMDVAWITRKLDPTALAPHRERFERVLQTLESGIALKRRIIDDLRPPLLQELGLVAALGALGEDFARSSGARVELDLPAGEGDGGIDLPPDLSLALFRIAQEALTNIRRHAHARRVKLGLELSAEAVSLAVEDDGVGFAPGQADGRHHGLAGMRHRVQMFAGGFSLASQPGQGTRIRASLPLPAAAQALSLAPDPQ